MYYDDWNYDEEAALNGYPTIKEAQEAEKEAWINNLTSTL